MKFSDDDKNLEAFARAALDHASTTFFQQGGAFNPMYLAVAGDGTLHLFMVPGVDDKDFCALLVRRYLAEIGAVRVALVTEAWTVDGDGDRVAAIAREGVAAQPDRLEVLMVIAEDRDGGGLSVRREIIREGDRARLGDPVLDRFDVSEGRIVGLLPRPGAKGSELH
jgi:hypothetical protein